MRGWRWLKRVLAASFLMAIAASVFLIASRFGIRDANKGKATIQASMTAAALLENSQLDEAISSYRSLLEKSPQDSSLATNLAIALVSKIKDQAKLVEDLEASDPRSQKTTLARESLDELFEDANTAIKQTLRTSGSKAATYQLAVELVMLQIADRPKSDVEKTLTDLIQRIVDFEKNEPGNPYLATILPELIEQLPSGKSNAKQFAVDNAVRILNNAFEKNPRNLYVLHRLASLLISNEDKRALQLVGAMIPLCKPLGVEGTENEVVTILEEAKDATATDPDLAMALLEQSQNLIVRTSAFRADERATRPNTLALIDLTDVQAALELVVDEQSPLDSVADKPLFIESKLVDSKLVDNLVDGVVDGVSVPILGQATCWFDWDIDLQPELVWVDGQKLSIGKWTSNLPSAIKTLATLAVKDGVHTIRPIDLFEVQFSSRPQRDYQNRRTEMAKSIPSDLIDQTVDRRADTIRDIVLIGDNGIQLVTLQETTQSVGTTSSPFQWRTVDEQVGLETITTAEECLPIDWDADGDLDLAVVSNGNLILMQNRGNRTFVNVDSFSSMPDESFLIQSISVCDYDRDQDLDILVSSSSGQAMGLMENILHGQFRFRSLGGQWNSLSNAKSLAVAELDGNVSWDWIAINSDGLYGVYTNTTSIGHVKPKLNIHYPQFPGSGLQIADFNNDGAPDSLVFGEKQTSIIWNSGSVGFEQVPTRLFAKDEVATSVSISDVDQDGLLEIAAIVNGSLRVAQISGNKTNRYTQVRLKGINDENGGGRVNQYAIGSLVELFSPSRYQAQIVQDDFCHFGLGPTEEPYNLRVIFTNGLTQNLLKPGVNTVIEEKQILKGSCPFAYGWDGSKWTLITDLLWNAPLGLQVTRGKPLPNRRRENLLIPGTHMQPRDGKYELRITEELWETAYFDHIQLTAVDHPVGTLLYSNEKVGPPSIAEPKLWLVDQRIPITSIVGSDKGDWSAELSSVDQNYAIPFKQKYCQGNVSKYYLELDLSRIPEVDKAQLYLTGWIYPTDTSLNISLDQNPAINHPVPPSLWSVDPQGEFTCVQPFMGFPGGKPKTIVIPLDDVFQSEDRRLRIETSCEIYWDEMFVAFGTPNDERLSIQTLEIEQANLDYRGFSELKPRRPDQHHDYDYQRLSTIAAWPPMDGFFTDYGNVRAALENDDDQIVVMGSGDEMQIRFTLGVIGNSQDGSTRDFILTNIGWDKDADLNTLEGQSSFPLPFASMQSYPPPFGQSSESKKVNELNAPKMHRKQLYRGFWNKVQY